MHVLQLAGVGGWKYPDAFITGYQSHACIALIRTSIEIVCCFDLRQKLSGLLLEFSSRWYRRHSLVYQVISTDRLRANGICSIYLL